MPGLGSLGQIGRGLSVSTDTVGRPIDAGAVVRNNIGEPVVRGELVAISPSNADLDAAKRLGFEVTGSDRLEALNLTTVSLAPPPGMTETEALRAVRNADPSGNFDFDHIYDPSGVELATTAPPAKGARLLRLYARGVSVGMIDAGIDTDHPSLAGAQIETQNVTDNARPPVTAHGTAVASLLVGDDKSFRGQLPGATLYAVDAFGGSRTGGSAVDIARALEWLAEKRVAVVNASLAGPPNALLAAAVHAFITSGHILVAAAGNAGPAAPPAFPAAYSGVVGVTSVDSARHLQIDANRGDVAFAALGVNIRAASLDGYGVYTGTSFAAPIVAGRFAILMPAPDPKASEAARAELVRAAERLGNQAIYGYGYVGPTALAAE